MFADREPAWRWVPRFEHVLIDQTRQRPATVPGALPARLYEGELKGRIRTIEAFLGRAVPWSTIEAATGIDEAAFRKLKQHVDADDDGPN